jgi:uncharacterized protein YerC
MPALSYSITISDEESAYLKSLIKTRTIQAQVVDRARILLWKSEAKTDKAIADGLGISVNTVRRCIDRYLNGGINLAIFDNDRSGDYRRCKIMDYPYSLPKALRSWLCRGIMDTGGTAQTHTGTCGRSWLSTLKDSYQTMASKISQKDGYKTIQNQVLS